MRFWLVILVLALALVGICYGIWSLTLPGPSSTKELAMYSTPEHLAAVAKAKAVAQEIAAGNCKIVSGEDKLKVITITFQCGSATETLSLGFQHLRYPVWRRLFELQPGALVKFVYEPTGWNEADVSAPENDELPAYYLTPVLKMAEPTRGSVVSLFSDIISLCRSILRS